jgi:hypothetical protein
VVVVAVLNLGAIQVFKTVQVAVLVAVEAPLLLVLMELVVRLQQGKETQEPLD